MAKRRRKILGGFTFGFISVVAIFVIMFVAFGMMNQSRHQEIQERFSEIPDPADRTSESVVAAATPDSVPAFPSSTPVALKQSWPSEPTPTEIRAAKEDWIRIINLYDVSTSDPNPKFREFDLWQDYRIYFRKKPVHDWAPIIRAEADEFLDYARVLLNGLNDLAATYSTRQSSRAWRNLRGYGDVERIILSMMDFLYLDAIIQSSDRNFDRAFESLMTGVRLTKTLLREEPHYAYWLRDYNRAYLSMTDSLQETFPPGTLTDEQLERWFKETRNARQRGLFMRVYQEEHYRDADGQNRYVKEYLTTQGFKDSLGHRQTKEAFKDSMKWFMDATAGRGKILEGLNDQVRKADTAQKLKPGPFYQIQQQASEPDDLLAEWELIPQAVFEARLDMTTVGLLIEQYRKRNGAYPETLDQLEMPFGDDVPKDVFTGQDYIYQRNESNFELRTAGPKGQFLGADPWEGKDYVDSRQLIWRGEERFQHGEMLE